VDNATSVSGSSQDALQRRCLPFHFQQTLGKISREYHQAFHFTPYGHNRVEITNPLLYVVDEAQSTATRYLGAFISSDLSFPRPVFKLILQCLEGLRLILLGTDISLGDLIPVLSSGVGKAPEYRLFHDTGSFDDPKLHEAYMQQYLPATFLNTDSGKQLLTRTWRWLRRR
jgi:hypothetical protein